MSTQPRPRPVDILLLLGVVSFSVFLRAEFVLRASWDIDESAPLWRATLMRSGEAPWVGLPTSLGVPHLIGTEVYLMPFTWFTDLTHVGFALSLVQLAALTTLAWQLGDSVRARIWPALLLTWLPSLLGTSLVPRHQYLSITVQALLLALLIRLWEGRERGTLNDGARSDRNATMYTVEAGLAVLLCGLLPTLHVVWFPAAMIQFVAVGVALHRHRAPLGPALGALAVALVPVGFLYARWLPAALGAFDQHSAMKAWPVVFIPVALAVAWRQRERVQRLLQRPSVLTRSATFLGLLAFLGALIAVLGPPLSRWPLRVLAPVGFAFAAAQAALLLPALPGIKQWLRNAGNGHNDTSTPVFLLLVGGACLLSGFGVTPQLFLPSGRIDFLHLLLLAPLSAFALLSVHSKARAACAVGAASLLCACAWFDPINAVEKRFTGYVSAEEMRQAVDWIAEQHQRQSRNPSVDVRYDLTRHRAWIPKFAEQQQATAYTIGRPMDWLLRQRHGLQNANEGRYARDGRGAYEVHYRDAVPANAAGAPAGTLDLDHITVLARVPPH